MVSYKFKGGEDINIFNIFDVSFFDMSEWRVSHWILFVLVFGSIYVMFFIKRYI
jgi:hypothetical protein